MNRFQDSHCDAASYCDSSLRSEEDRRVALKGGRHLPSNYEEEVEEEPSHRLGYEPMYPSLEDVESVPVLSSGEAFRYAEEQMLLRYGREPSSRRSSSALPTTPQHSRNPSTSSRHQPDRRRSRDSTSSSVSSLHSHGSSDSRKPPGVGSHRYHGPSTSAPSKHGSNLKPPPNAPSASSSSTAIKGFDFLDRKPPAVLPPAATPGAVPVSHNNGTHSSSPTWPHGAPPLPKHHHQQRVGPTFPLLELEVGPGSYLPLHGSDETYFALRCGRLQSASCAVCETSLKCVSHAAHVLCPVCRVVSPVEGGNCDIDEHDEYNYNYDNGAAVAAWSSNSIGGVGLGMSQQEYRRCLAELHHEEQRLERRIYL